jgi:hypothetical protein
MQISVGEERHALLEDQLAAERKKAAVLEADVAAGLTSIANLEADIASKSDYITTLEGIRHDKVSLATRSASTCFLCTTLLYMLASLATIEDYRMWQAASCCSTADSLSVQIVWKRCKHSSCATSTWLCMLQLKALFHTLC